MSAKKIIQQTSLLFVFVLLASSASAQTQAEGLSSIVRNGVKELGIILPMFFWGITAIAGALALASIYKAATAKDRNEDAGQYWKKFLIYTVVTLGATLVSLATTSLSGQTSTGNSFQYEASDWN